MKTPLDIYLRRHSPLSPDLWLHYSRLSARYISRHVPGADISLYGGTIPRERGRKLANRRGVDQETGFK